MQTAKSDAWQAVSNQMLDAQYSLITILVHSKMLSVICGNTE